VKHLPNANSGGVIAYGADHFAARPNRGDVLRYVRRAAERKLPLGYPDDRDRRFRGDSIDVAAQIYVEHGVANDCDAPAACGIQERLQPLACYRLDHSTCEGKGTSPPKANGRFHREIHTLSAQLILEGGASAARR
jgi:hypothetical protein